MAEDRDDSQRTEEPTQRRLDEAHRKGDIVKSAELNSLVLLSAGVLALAMFGSMSVQRFAADFRGFLENPADIVLNAGTASALLEYVPSNHTVQVFPPSVDCSMNWRTSPFASGVKVIRLAMRVPSRWKNSPRKRMAPSLNSPSYLMTWPASATQICSQRRVPAL